MLTPQPPPGRPRTSTARLLISLLVGSALAAALWLYGTRHTPTGVAVNLAGFSNPQSVKSWLATAAAAFAVVQLLSAQAMYGKLPGAAQLASRAWVSTVHRWSGRAAFLMAVPVAAHCLYALGAQTFDTRTGVHSLMGCFFFGVFTTKMLTLRTRGIPNWALPLLGGLAFTSLIVLWITSAVWFFTLNGIHY
ncbi:DUF6529 family protein [Streptomyces sp. NBC_00233]|uniref:DUF6529 family protein n=1 Tax=Streptomyces sp. NBC_00233 TaxID=2975686 RepID=UPI0022523FCE|nr:DUF6529 family protein [Streptomyces sp. NBC_00233]MCX5233289.1 DUF6529 family protein [Streptomyces sp. NBC_00233]